MSGTQRRAPAEVCLRCGSLDPRVPSPTCTHPEVALLQELRPEFVDLLARIRRLQNALVGQLATLGEAARLEVASGRARYVEDPPTYKLANLVYLKRRSEFVDRDGSPSAPPSREAPVGGPGGLRLTPPSSAPPRKRKAEPKRKAPAPVPGQGSLLEA